MKIISPTAPFLPIFSVNNFLIEIRNQIGHRLMIAAKIT